MRFLFMTFFYRQWLWLRLLTILFRTTLGCCGSSRSGGFGGERRNTRSVAFFEPPSLWCIIRMRRRRRSSRGRMSHHRLTIQAPIPTPHPTGLVLLFGGRMRLTQTMPPRGRHRDRSMSRVPVRRRRWWWRVRSAATTTTPVMTEDRQWGHHR